MSKLALTFHGKFHCIKTIKVRKENLCFMFLYILRELLMLAESHFERALFAGTQNDHKPITGYFGHGSGRLLN